MKDPDLTKINFSGSSIAKNTIFNLLGYGIPFIFAIILIPILINGLGIERFGILNLAWMVLGYFSFFDFGIGRSLTKVIAEKLGLNQSEKIPVIFWTSLILMLIISIVTVLGLSFLFPTLVQSVFKISTDMQAETLIIFYVLAISVPIVSTTAGLRGVLEAYQKFGVINIMRTILGIFTFLGPLLVLLVTNSLFWIIIFLIFIRIIIWVLYLLQCFNINESIKNNFRFDINSVKDVLKFSIWITIANFISPVIFYADRFLIGALISAAAISYYATPYEVVTKLLLIPTALVGVIFPIFSASFVTNYEYSKKIFISAVKIIFMVLYPIVLVMVTFSFEGMEIWLGIEFAKSSSLILQLLALGVLFNGIAFIPFNYFQGIGKPKIPALVNLIELPFYLLALWLATSEWGIEGAAMVWLARILIDTTVLSFLSHKMFAIRFESNFSVLFFLLALISLLIPFLISNIFLKIIFVCGILLIFFIVTWKYLLSGEEKYFLLSKLKTNG